MLIAKHYDEAFFSYEAGRSAFHPVRYVLGADQLTLFILLVEKFPPCLANF